MIKNIIRIILIALISVSANLAFAGKPHSFTISE